MDPPPDKIRELISRLNEDQLQQLWKLHEGQILGPLLDITKKACENISLLVMDRLDSEPVQDYVTELETRHRILQRIQRNTMKCSDDEINMALFAVIMVAPVNILESRVAALEDSNRRNDQAEVDEMLARWRSACINGIQAFMPPQSTSLPRRLTDLPQASSDAVNLCKERDSNVCHFTGMYDPQAAYIIPLEATKSAAVSRIADMLEIFWGVGTAARLSALIGDPRITNSPQNMLSMNHQLHDWFDGCKIALKPLRKTDEGYVQVQFHWLRQGKCVPHFTTATYYPPFEMLMENSGILKDGSWDIGTAHRRSGLRLETGQTFILRSDVLNHIPSFELLELS
ncbi:uncharacterized protein TRIVIDRAFT_62401 [Trichoderma virens Gv29-8]|uniref:HNH nuclease domain-containing protein n=1 Tax=Hypocrea virens (strain Gv29-8 / FGSC 10586) TaxID=413071 RepID=G9MJS2_HYPVG|nr:uncharacterized protein TRIVIDRAFT_62401 [Trichoderma virens Gv29-8]EHK25734.1 hypothetical protein TRIVIDRAFT_62401 [Trichoderma virens Gv29-8]UKZ48447.1 hypothetical protein TrVGV298_002671 [Trichoderma virens]